MALLTIRRLDLVVIICEKCGENCVIYRTNIDEYSCIDESIDQLLLETLFRKNILNIFLIISMKSD